MRTSNTIMASDLGLPVNDNAQRLKRSSIMTAENLHITETASLDELEKEIIQARLAIFDNNPQKTAKSLGLSRSAYYRRIEKYQLLGPSKP